MPGLGSISRRELIRRLRRAGFAGPVPDLGFYFKKPVGDSAPLTFEDQLAALERLESRIESRIAEKSRGDG